MTHNKTLIYFFFLLILSACSKQSGEEEQQKGYYYTGSLFDPYIAQGSIFTREVKNMPLATNSAAIAAYMPKMPAEYLPEKFKKTVLTSLCTTSYNIPIYARQKIVLSYHQALHQVYLSQVPIVPVILTQLLSLDARLILTNLTKLIRRKSLMLRI